MTHSLKAFHHPENPDLRVAFRHPNRFLVQSRSDREGTRERDPWDDLYPSYPTRKAAIARMYQRHPLKLRA